MSSLFCSYFQEVVVFFNEFVRKNPSVFPKAAYIAENKSQVFLFSSDFILHLSDWALINTCCMQPPVLDEN